MSDSGGERRGTRDGEAEAREDRALMERVRQHDEVALGSLMEHWERPVKAVIARLVLNTHEAEELAQETFVRVWQQRQKYRVGAEVRPWIFSIAVNLARNRLRWWRRRPAVSLDDWNESRGETLATNEVGATALEQRERAESVRAAIAALPAELREAIVLFEYEQMSHADIAATVGATPKAVETRIYRAREKLRVTLKRWL